MQAINLLKILLGLQQPPALTPAAADDLLRTVALAPQPLLPAPYALRPTPYALRSTPQILDAAFCTCTLYLNTRPSRIPQYQQPYTCTQVLEPLAQRLRLRLDEAHALLAEGGEEREGEADGCGSFGEGLGGGEGEVSRNLKREGAGVADADGSGAASGRGRGDRGFCDRFYGTQGDAARERARMHQELEQRTTWRVFVSCKLALRQLEAALALARTLSRLPTDPGDPSC